MDDKRNYNIVRGDGEVLESYLRRISEHVQKLEWQSDGHRMWYTGIFFRTFIKIPMAAGYVSYFKSQDALKPSFSLSVWLKDEIYEMKE